jgi:adenosine deaminase
VDEVHSLRSSIIPGVNRTDDRRLRDLPKIELHCHLDACVRIETAGAIGRELGMSLPEPLRDALVAPEVCDNLFDYLRRLDLALDLMQRASHLRRIARELMEDFARDGVVYAEVRFAPQLHTRDGLTMQEVVDAVHQGLAEGSRAHGVTAGLILCCLRHRPVEEGVLVARLAGDNRDVVCALDLAGDEGRFPEAAPHVAAFRVARDAGLRLTVHAGENAGASSVREALDLLGAERIGHGVRVEEDPALVERVAAERVALDMCPRSNVQTRAVASLASHPIDRLLRKGLRVTVSTDGRTTSDTSVTGELERLRGQFGWGMAEFLAVQRNAAQAVFAPAAVRDALVERIAAAENDFTAR